MHHSGECVRPTGVAGDTFHANCVALVNGVSDLISNSASRCSVQRRAIIQCNVQKEQELVSTSVAHFAAGMRAIASHTREKIIIGIFASEWNAVV